jgi:putative flippase GtrA
MKDKLQLRRFLTFALVGLGGTAAHYALLVALVELAGADPLLGATAGFVLGALVNYWLSHRIVFRSGRAHIEALPRFLTVAVVGLIWTAVLMALFTRWLALPYLPAQVVTTGILLFWHYAGNALWTFRRHHSA